MNAIFTAIEDKYKSETDLRDALKHQCNLMRQLTREYLAQWQQIHQVDFTEENVQSLMEKTPFDKFHPHFEQINKLIPPTQFYKYASNFWGIYRDISLIFLLKCYFTNKTLGELNTLNQDLKMDQYENLEFTLEDFLHGVCQVCKELARYSTNCVTRRSFSQPSEVLQFLNHIYSGMSTINLKNSDLRREFDGLKYQIKAVEGIVYDLTLRNLASPPTTEKKD